MALQNGFGRSGRAKLCKREAVAYQWCPLLSSKKWEGKKILAGVLAVPEIYQKASWDVIRKPTADRVSGLVQSLSETTFM